MRLALAAVTFVLIACGSGSADRPSGELGGTFRDTPYTTVAGASALERNGRLIVQFANQPFPCGDPLPAADWIVVVIMVPVGTAPGTYSLAGSSDMVASVTRYSKTSTAAPSSDSFSLRGTLWLDSTGATVSGALSTENLKGTKVSGSFSAPRCAGDGG